MTRREKKTAIFSAREPPAGTALTSRCNCACLGSPLGSPCRAPAHAKGCGQYQTINDVGGSLAECRRAQTPSASILLRCNLCVKPRRTRAGMTGVVDPRWSAHEAADAAANRRSPRDLKAIYVTAHLVRRPCSRRATRRVHCHRNSRRNGFTARMQATRIAGFAQRFACKRNSAVNLPEHSFKLLSQS